ncbi:unnamed protein product [Xylocopa violacea]|uniref:Transposase n=1 Tax=Xylocopa violacea TaxID=135666 RepID=A0ABP1NSH0_XYLVO
MGKKRGVHETTPELRNRMVGMYEAGLGLREIASAVNCSQRTVKRWLNRFDKEGTVETRERCGRKRATTVEQDEAIVRLATQTPITAAKAVLPALGLTCSVDTIRERLHKAGIHNWSPSRKYMKRIPLGDTDGAAVQQPVWRPTGTQLGKKKSSKDSNKNRKSVSVVKKRNPPRKIRAKDLYVGDGAPVEVVKDSNEQEFVYPQPNVTQSENALHPGTGFDDALNLVQQPTQPAYQHTGLNISQNWPLDLVQGNHHYSQAQPNSISHEQTELHGQQKQQTITDQTHALDQQRGQIRADVQQQQHCDHLRSLLASPPTSSNTHGSQDNNPSSSVDSNQSKDSSKGGGNTKIESQKRKKKGGKAKGTLETSVEIRNRMIGMSEAGLSTLSIALAIDRSERTVKRWLERWHKEGNVQTKERKGRRRITTKEQDEAIVAMATQQPLTAAKHVAPALGLKCSVDTIRERLHKAGIHSWKLGKKHGEGNAVHTVHLWQPSGNRPNKPKLLGEKKKKANNIKKRGQTSNGAQKRLSTRKRKFESASMKMVPPSVNIIPEQPVGTTLPFHNSGTMANYVSGSDMLQTIQNIAAPPPPPPTIVQPQSNAPAALSAAPQSIGQSVGSMMQPRSDCRLAPAIVPPPMPAQGNTGITYPSCMIGSNSHTGHMEQPDPLNYEPYIWSF